MVKFRRSGPALLITSAVLVICAITAIAHLLTNRLLQSAHEGDYKLMQQVFSDTLGDSADEVTGRAEAVAAMPEVRAALAARDRPRLLAATQRMWEVQEQKYDLDAAQFHVPPGVSFLRLHKPEAFGDDQTSYRPMLAEVHQGKVVKRGLAITRAGPFVYGIVPVLDEGGKFVGTFEMGLDFAPELDKVKQSFGLESVLFFDEKLLREIAKDVPAEVLSPKNQVGRFIRFYTTNPTLAGALVGDKDIDVTEPRAYERELARTTWGVQLMPVYGYGSKQIGVVAMATDFGEDKRLARRALVWEILAALFGVVFMTGIILVVVRGVVLAPIAALGERMRALADGQEAPPADRVDRYCDELRPLAESYERLRAERGARDP
jgi:hypothetical protein